MQRCNVLLLVIFLYTSKGYSQSKVPAMFHNYDKFYTEFSKLDGYKHIDYENSNCRKYSEWKLTLGNDSLEAFISIGSGAKETDDVGISITIARPFNTFYNWDYHNEAAGKIARDLRHIVNNERFSKLNLEIGMSNDRVDNSTGLVISTEGIVTSLTDSNRIKDLRNYATTRISVYNAEKIKEHVSIDYGPDLEDTATILILPKPELLDSSVSNPPTVLEAVLEDNSIIKPYIEKLMGDTFRVAFENEYDLNYSINTNRKFNCAGNDTTESNIEFSLNGDCDIPGGFLSLSYNCAGQKPEPQSWARYLALVDSVTTYLNVEKPIVFTDYNLCKYSTAKQTVYPAFGKCVIYNFSKSNCYLPCHVLDKTNFSADIYFCGCSFEYIK